MFLFIGTLNIEDKEEKGAKIENAADGLPGAYIHNRESPRKPNPFSDFNLSQSINNYKKYVRENLFNHFQQSDLQKFLTDLETDKRIQCKYSSLSFVDELFGLKKQYFDLHHKISFDLSVRSLCGRIDEYSQKPTRDILLLKYLKAAALSKLGSIRKMSKHISTFDLLEIFCVAQEHIYDLNESKRNAIINEHMKKYAGSINRKNVSAKAGIEKETIIIEKALVEVTNQLIPELVDEQKLNELLIRQRILFWLKMIGRLTPRLIDARVFLSSKKYQKVSTKPTESNQIDGINTKQNEITKVAQSINDLLESSYQIIHIMKLQNLHQKLTNIANLLRKYFESNTMEMIKMQIIEINSKIAEERGKFGNLIDLFNSNFVTKIQNELYKTIFEEKIELERQNDRESDPMRKFKH